MKETYDHRDVNLLIIKDKNKIFPFLSFIKDKIAIFTENFFHKRQNRVYGCDSKTKLSGEDGTLLGKDTIIILTGQRPIGKSYILRLFRDM